MAFQLIENGAITDVYADDVHHIEFTGSNVRLIYFRWRLADDGVTWQRVALDVAIVRPAQSFRFPVHTWPNVRLVGCPERAAAAVQ